MEYVEFKEKKYKISCNMIKHITRDFSLSKEEILDCLYTIYPELFDTSNLFCKSGSGEKLWTYFKFNKQERKYENRADNGVLGYVFLKELYSLKFYEFYKKLGLPANLKSTYYYLIDKQTSLELINEKLIRETYTELNSGENSPMKKFKKINPLKYEEVSKSKSSKKKEIMKDKSNNAYSREFWIRKGFTLEEAKIKVKERNKFCKESFIKKGFSLQEAKILAKKNNPSNLDNYENINDFLKKSPIRKEYWLELGYSLKEAKQLIKQYRGTTIEYYLAKGFTFEESQIKAKENNVWCIEYWIKRNKSIKEFELFKQEMFKKNSQTLGIGISNESKLFFKQLLDFLKLPKKYIEENIYTFNTKGYEKCLLGYFPDYLDEKRKLIIEFNGDLFHAHPLLFKDADYPNPYNLKLSAKQIRDKDERRNSVLKEEGYKVIVVWSSDNKRKKIEEIAQLYSSF